ncbi:MAG: hypothetical protein ISS93_02605 [Candidatus Aenigmarchaeota archaeon]|nr:hypothetical protein [Candidatus Aenigmarchaeota archaeon]
MTNDITRRTFMKAAAAAALGVYKIGGTDEGPIYRDETLGKAYGFFDAPASEYDIAKELPAIRKAVKTPRELKFVLRDGDASQTRDPARATGRFKYVLEASYRDHSNAEAARELADIFNQAVHTRLYGEDWQTGYMGRIAYKEAGHWKHVDEGEVFSEPKEL